MFISPTYGSDRLTERIWVPLKEVADTAKVSNSSTEAFSIDNGTSTEDGSVGENVGEKHKNVGEKIREEILSAIKADSKISAVTLAKKNQCYFQNSGALFTGITRRRYYYTPRGCERRILGNKRIAYEILIPKVAGFCHIPAASDTKKTVLTGSGRFLWSRCCCGYGKAIIRFTE